MKTVTQWFGMDESPVHPGLYEVSFRMEGREFSIKTEWNGERWSRETGLSPSSACGDEWRGLAEKPKTKGGK